MNGISHLREPSPTSRGVLLFGAIVLGMLAGPSPGDGKKKDEVTFPNSPPVAWVHDGCLYAASYPADVVAKAETGSTINRLDVWRAPLDPKVKAVPSKTRAGIIQFEGQLLRWRIHHGRFWQTGSRARFPCFFERVPLARLENPPHSWSCYPIVAFDGQFPDAEAELADAHFDLVPSGKDGVAVLMAWKRELRAWRGRLIEPKDEQQEPEAAWEGDQRDRTKDDEIPKPPTPSLLAKTDVGEAFRAFEDGKNYYLVTASGKVHACARKGGKATRPLWDDAKRPVVALVGDAGTGRTFAFTAPGEKGEPVYFELADKLSPTAYDRKGVPRYDESAPLASMLPYARILAADKKLALPPAKKER